MDLTPISYALHHFDTMTPEAFRAWLRANRDHLMRQEEGRLSDAYNQGYEEGWEEGYQRGYEE